MRMPVPEPLRWRLQPRLGKVQILATGDGVTYVPFALTDNDCLSWVGLEKDDISEVKPELSKSNVGEAIRDAGLITVDKE